MDTEELSSEQSSLLSYVSYATMTDVGKKRSENQDSYGVCEGKSFRVYIVADGMGGVKGGAVASAVAIETFCTQFPVDDELTEHKLIRAVQEANRAVHSRGQEDPELSGMGTTFVALGFTFETVFVLHVGDSRAYRIRGSRIEQLTHDHTLIQELVDSGAISESQAEDHPVSHMLTRSLGPVDSVKPDCWKMTDGPVSGDQYLICSDGLYNLVSHQEIADIVRESASDDEACKRLVDEANARGGTDNITVSIMSVSLDYPRTIDDLPPAMRDASQSEDTLELKRSELDQVTEEVIAEHESEQAEQSEDDSHESPEIGRPGVSLENQEALQEQVEASFHREETVASTSETVEPIAADFRRRRVMPIVVGIVAGITVIFLVLYAGQHSQDAMEVSSVEEVSEEKSPVVEDAPGEKPKVVSLDTEPQDEAEAEEVVAPPSDSDVEAAAKEAESLLAAANDSAAEVPEAPVVDDIEQRRKRAEDELSALRAQLTLLTEPLSGSIADRLKESEALVESKEDELRDIRSQLDIATRKLSVWIGRRRRLETSDPLNLSLEVSAASEPVRLAKEAFDTVTWQYLKKAEALRYEPDDVEKRKQLVDLKKQREELLTRLGEVVTKAVQDEIQKIDREIAQLTFERDALTAAVASAKRERRVVNTVLRGSSADKEDLKKEIEQAIELSEAELTQLGPNSDLN